MNPPAELRFLVVDDSAAMRCVARARLEEMGCRHVEEAGDGAVALRMLRARPCDFIVSDINMPNMNGFDLLDAVKAEPGLMHIPVLMVTLEARLEDLLLAAQRGAAGCVVKPFSRATLEEKVTTILQAQASVV